MTVHSWHFWLILYESCSRYTHFNHCRLHGASKWSQTQTSKEIHLWRGSSRSEEFYHHKRFTRIVTFHCRCSSSLFYSFKDEIHSPCILEIWPRSVPGCSVCSGTPFSCGISILLYSICPPCLSATSMQSISLITVCALLECTWRQQLSEDQAGHLPGRVCWGFGRGLWAARGAANCERASGSKLLVWRPTLSGKTCHITQPQDLSLW